MRVCISFSPSLLLLVNQMLMGKSNRIVEYATRDQAQNAVNSLSNQNLMGRLVYVREVSLVSQEKTLINTNLLIMMAKKGP